MAGLTDIRLRSGRWTVAAAVSLAAIAAIPAIAHASDGGETLDPGDLGQLISALVIFLLLLGIMWRYAWKPITLSLRRREESIARMIDEAQSKHKESQDLLAGYKEKIEKAENEARELLAAARQQAAEAKQQILDEARHEARRAIDDAKEDIRLAKEAAVQELESTLADMVTEVAEKVIKRELKPEDHKLLLDESTQELRKRALSKA